MNGPATVNGEQSFNIPLEIFWEGKRETTHKSGELPKLYFSLAF